MKLNALQSDAMCMMHRAKVILGNLAAAKIGIRLQMCSCSIRVCMFFVTMVDGRFFDGAIFSIGPGTDGRR